MAGTTRYLRRLAQAGPARAQVERLPLLAPPNALLQRWASTAPAAVPLHAGAPTAADVTRNAAARVREPELPAADKRRTGPLAHARPAAPASDPPRHPTTAAEAAPVPVGRAQDRSAAPPPSVMDAKTVTSAHAVATDVVPPASPAESARPATLPPSQHLPPVQPPAPRTAVASAAAAEPSIRIGTVEVRVTPPAPSPPPRRSAPAAMPARGTLSRGFTSSFGLKEG